MHPRASLISLAPPVVIAGAGASVVVATFRGAPGAALQARAGEPQLSCHVEGVGVVPGVVMGVAEGVEGGGVGGNLHGLACTLPPMPPGEAALRVVHAHTGAPAGAGSARLRVRRAPLASSLHPPSLPAGAPGAVTLTGEHLHDVLLRLEGASASPPAPCAAAPDGASARCAWAAFPLPPGRASGLALSVDGGVSWGGAGGLRLGATAPISLYAAAPSFVPMGGGGGGGGGGNVTVWGAGVPTESEAAAAGLPPPLCRFSTAPDAPVAGFFTGAPGALACGLPARRPLPAGATCVEVSLNGGGTWEGAAPAAPTAARAFSWRRRPRSSPSRPPLLRCPSRAQRAPPSR